MTTRIYFIPHNQIGRQIMNTIITKFECSVGDLKLNRQTDTIRFPITCESQYIPRIEALLRRYDMM